MTTTRVRFAPSPTGYLHVGGARTALFNYLLAKQTGGTFVLRVEDTDQDRNKEEHVQAILDGMAWLGMTPDEGPFFQSDGFFRHRAEAEELMQRGHAYPIFGDDYPEGAPRDARPSVRVRAQQFAEAGMPAAALHARMLQEPYAVAFLVPAKKVEWKDLVHGRLEFNADAIEDFLLVRSDGVPLYNMACVSDDIEHGITHVLRGDDHIANTPKQLLLYDAIGHARPEFGHLPMILGSDGQRLSKRHGATSVQQYQEHGVMPETMVNFLALLGWNPGDDTEILSFEELVKKFSVQRILRKASVFDTQKLEWMNGEYLHRMDRGAVLGEVWGRLTEEQRASCPGEGQWLHELVEQYLPRSRTLPQLLEKIQPFFLQWVPVYDEVAAQKLWLKDTNQSIKTLGAVSKALERASFWTREALEQELRALADSLGLGFGKIVNPLRLALIGGDGCGIDWILYLLDPPTVQRRLAAAITYLEGA